MSKLTNLNNRSFNKIVSNLQKSSKLSKNSLVGVGSNNSNNYVQASIFDSDTYRLTTVSTTEDQFAEFLDNLLATKATDSTNVKDIYKNFNEACALMTVKDLNTIKALLTDIEKDYCKQLSKLPEEQLNDYLINRAIDFDPTTSTQQNIDYLYLLLIAVNNNLSCT